MPARFPHQRLRPVQRRITADVFHPSMSAWLDVRADIMRIETEQFGDGAFDEEYLAYEFTDPANTVVLMRDTETDTVFGFTYAIPVGDVDPARWAPPDHTAYICDTALDHDHQRRGLVADMMAVLEEELRRRGYRYLERDAAVSNGYADKIARAYGDRIVAQSEPHSSDYGMQVFFRIRL
ncbi:MAG: hypothetical protein NVS2B16_22300 [Chloroflexota bacterium]